MKRELEGVRVGDRLKTMHSSFSAQYCEFTVERVTATQVACTNGARFKIDNGMEIGTGDFRRPVYTSFLTDKDALLAAQEQRIKNARHAFERIVITADNIDAAEAFIGASKSKAST